MTSEAYADLFTEDAVQQYPYGRVITVYGYYFLSVNDKWFQACRKIAKRLLHFPSAFEFPFYNVEMGLM